LKTYDVWIERSAETDLLGILRYITEILREPATARRVYLSIYDQIMTLRQFPERYPVVDVEPYKSQGVRKMPAENYYVFYVINENVSEASEVDVFRILYNRRDWASLLRRD
jgi:plasmid stabilization system protein ParE